MSKQKTVSIEFTQKQYDALVIFFTAGEYLLESSDPGRKKNAAGDEVYLKLFEKGPEIKSRFVVKKKKEESFSLSDAAEKEINRGIKNYNHAVVNEAMMSMMTASVKGKKK